MTERTAVVTPTDVRYGFNGKEVDSEINGNGNAYDFGARMYDARLGRWWSVDPLVMRYLHLSPFNYTNNQPIVAIDPDGRKILFINGYWCPGACGWLIGADEPGRGYWGAGFAEQAQHFFNDHSIIDEDNYIDGSSMFGGDEDGADRFEKGRAYAEANLDVLTSDMIEGETFKLVGHSEGCAMSAGIADYLIEKGFKVEFVVHLSPDESSDFETPTDPTTYQLSYDDDPVTVHGVIEGTDKSGAIHDPSLSLKFQHGETGSPNIFKKLSDLKTASIQRFITMCNNIANEDNPVVLPAQGGSSPNGTIFSEINGVELYDLETCEPID
jgi:RHS repeat-associated protein